MKSIVLFSFLFVFGASQSWANLYQCDETSMKPVAVTEKNNPAVSYETTDPFMLNHYKDARFHEKKTPFLVYYAIDSAEAFMQYSVRFEIAKLIDACNKSNNVNFVGLLNSLYVEKNQVIVCKDKKTSYLDLAKFPTLNTNLRIKRKYISTGDHATNDDIGPLSYLVRYFKHSNKAFGRYPLAHPDFLHDLIDFVLTEKSLFPRDQFIPFLNLKSHGNKQAVLAGMQECQSRAKVLSSRKVVKNILNRKEQKLLDKTITPPEIVTKIDEYEEALSKLHLGSDIRIGDSHLGNSHLGNSHLGDAIQSLGVNEGLGTEFAFGTYHITLNWVLADLFKNGTNNGLGFMMLESCDTNRNVEFFHSYRENVLGFYSAKHSLWYRNLNWWTLLERAEGSSLKLMEILKEETSKIQNIKVISSQTNS